MDDILINHFRIEKNAERNEEIISCITDNLKLNFFKEVRLIIEGDIPSNFSKELDKIQTNSNLVIETTPKRLTYKEIFKTCNYEPDKTFYLTNADIAYDESISKIKNLKKYISDGIVLAQHRYNLIPKTDDTVFELTPPITGDCYSGSADAFIFKTPIEFSHEFNFFGGTSYCDQHLSSLLSKSGRLCISIKDIICTHKHSSKINEKGRVEDEDYTCTKGNNCKDNLSNSCIKYNPILETKELDFIYNLFQKIKDSNFKNLELLCQAFLAYKHAPVDDNSVEIPIKKRMLFFLDKIINLGISAEDFASTLSPTQVFKWHGFPNPSFILKTGF